MTPVVVFANPRTGSTALFGMLERLNAATPNEEVEIVNTSELFDAENNALNAFPLFQVILTGCGQSSAVSELLSRFDNHAQRISAEFDNYLRKKVEGEWSFLRPLFRAYKTRMENPMSLFKYLRLASWPSKRPLVAFKIFDQHMFELGITPPKFLKEMEKTTPAKYMVLWRRRLIESYVSKVIAEETNAWTAALEKKLNVTSAVTTVSIKKKDLENYIRVIQNYYKSVRHTLESKGIDYEVFEYSRDVKDPENQVITSQRMADFLNLNVTVTAELVEGNSVKKQAKSSLAEQVENWDEVVKWGYAAEVDGWLDVFAE